LAAGGGLRPVRGRPGPAVGGALPMLLLGLMLLYYRFGKGGSMDDAPAPSEIKKVSKKSLKHQAKKNKVK